MKRIVSVLVAAILIVAMLTACGGAKNVDLKNLMSTVNSQFNISDLKTLESTDDLNRYYQINADDVKQFAAELSTAAKQYVEVVLVEAKDQTAADNVKKQLEAHLNSQISTAKSYDAAQVDMIQSCSVQQSGNFVYLVVSDAAGKINEAVAAALK